MFKLLFQSVVQLVNTTMMRQACVDLVDTASSSHQRAASDVNSVVWAKLRGPQRLHLRWDMFRPNYCVCTYTTYDMNTDGIVVLFRTNSIKNQFYSKFIWAWDISELMNFHSEKSKKANQHYDEIWVISCILLFTFLISIRRISWMLDPSSIQPFLSGGRSGRLKSPPYFIFVNLCVSWLL